MCNLFGPVKRFFGFYEKNSDNIMGNTTHSNCVGKHEHTNCCACRNSRPIHYHGCCCLRFIDKKPDHVIKKPEYNNCGYCKQLYHIVEKLVNIMLRLEKRTKCKYHNNKESSLNITKSNRSVLRFKDQEAEEIPVKLNPTLKPTAKNNLPLIIKPILKPSMQTNNEFKIEHINKNYSSDSISNKSVKGSIIDVIKKFNPKYTKEIHYKKDKIVLNSFNSSKISKDELVGGQIVTNYDDYLSQIPENTKNKKKIIKKH